MPAPYSKIARVMWGDEKFRRLSPLKASGQALWCYLLTGPHCTPIPGLIPRMGIGTLADALKWPYSAVATAWREIETEGMAESDWNAGVVWMPNAIEYDDPISLNQIRGWGKVPLPQCPLVARALKSFRVRLASRDNPSWVETFDEAFREGFAHVITEGIGEAYGDPNADPRTRTGTRSNSPPVPPVNGGDAKPDRIRIHVVRADRNEAKLWRQHNGGCPHEPECETFSICIEHIAVAIAVRRHAVRQQAN